MCDVTLFDSFQNFSAMVLAAPTDLIHLMSHLFMIVKRRIRELNSFSYSWIIPTSASAISLLLWMRHFRGSTLPHATASQNIWSVRSTCCSSGLPSQRRRTLTTLPAFNSLVLLPFSVLSPNCWMHTARCWPPWPLSAWCCSAHEEETLAAFHYCNVRGVRSKCF